MDVSRFIGVAVAERRDRAVRGDGRRRGTAFADPEIDRQLRRLTPPAVEGAEAHAHGAVRSANFSAAGRRVARPSSEARPRSRPCAAAGRCGVEPAYRSAERSGPTLRTSRHPPPDRCRRTGAAEHRGRRRERLDAHQVMIGQKRDAAHGRAARPDDEPHVMEAGRTRYHPWREQQSCQPILISTRLPRRPRSWTRSAG